METPVPGASTPAEVAAEALSNLADGPTLFATDDVRAGAEVFATMSRNDAVRMVLSFQDDVMGKDEGAQ
jgi:hypothetical protein